MTEPETSTDKEPTSEALAAIIVAHRSLGMFREQARSAMAELMRRKEDGDSFDFEAFIDQKIDDLPKSKVSPEVVKFLSSLSFIGGAR